MISMQNRCTPFDSVRSRHVDRVDQGGVAELLLFHVEAVLRPVDQCQQAALRVGGRPDQVGAVGRGDRGLRVVGVEDLLDRGDIAAGKGGELRRRQAQQGCGRQAADLG